MPTRTETLPIDRQPSGPGVLLSARDFAVLMDEIDRLRADRRMERDPASLDGAALLTSLRTAGVEEALVEQVAALSELASMVEDLGAVNGGAGLGSIVTVQDRSGRAAEYELVGRSLPAPPRTRVTLESPTGEALLGARPGDIVRVTLPNGRSRRVRVINVTPPATTVAHGRPVPTTLRA